MILSPRLNSLFLLYSFTSLFETTEYDALNKGILFHKESKILLAEKFVNVQFLVPFPKYNFTMKTQVEDMLAKLAEMWSQPSAECPLDFSQPFNSSHKPFNLNWMLAKIQNETNAAQQEVEHMRNITAKFLSNDENDEKRNQKSQQQSTEINNREKRGAPVVAAAAVAGIALFGASGIIMGGSSECGFLGVFGNCQNTGRKNAENIEKLSEYANQLTDYVLEIEQSSNEKFFLISNEIAEIAKIQKEMQENQNKNWKIVQQQFEIFQNNFHVLRDCTQMLFSNQQLNFNFDTAASLLNILYADVKSYRSALYAYSINLLNSIPILLDKRLPMSLVPRESLIAVLDSVHDAQKYSTDKLSLAIPMKDLMSYYDARLLIEISTVKQGLLLTLAIPLASRTTTFTVYSAHLVPMPQPDPSEALEWVIEGSYLAISQDSMETTTLTQTQLDNCIGSSTYRICHETMETHLSQSSCLATLYYQDPIVALAVCEQRKILLPIPEKATNLGFGIWLITSARHFKWRQHIISGTESTAKENKDGCKICLITLQCGEQLISKHIKIRSDLSSCSTIPAVQIDVKLDDPLQKLISTVPDLDQLPYYKSKADANIALFQQMKLELTMMSVDNLRQEDYDKIAEPIVHKMQLLKPTLIEKLDSYVPIKVSLSLTVFVFIGNLLLHILVMYLYHKFQFIRNLTPKFLKSPESKIPIKQVVSVAKDQFPLVQSMDHKLKNKMTFINESTTDEETIPNIDRRLTKVESLVYSHQLLLIEQEKQKDTTDQKAIILSQSQFSLNTNDNPNDNQHSIYGSTPNLQQQQPPHTNATTTQIPTNTSKTT